MDNVINIEDHRPIHDAEAQRAWNKAAAFESIVIHFETILESYCDEYDGVLTTTESTRISGIAVKYWTLRERT